MQVLITGGTGFIGSRLARRFLEGGDRVRLLAMRRTPVESANADALLEAGAELVEGSVADRALQKQALDGIDVVHHIAATMREADVPDSVFWDTNVAATQDLVKASREAGVERFVYCSTMGVTGGVKGRRVDETEPFNTKDIYGRTKAAAEDWVLGFAREEGFPATAVRPVDVYGPGDHRLLKLFRMIQKGRFFYLGNGEGTRHMVFIDDLLDGMLAAQECPAAVGEVFFLAGPSPISLRELVNTVAGVLDVERPTLRLPYRPVWLMSAAVEAACKPFGLQPPIYPRRVDFYAHDYAFDWSKAQRLLGYEPRVDVPDGVERTIAAYRADGLLA